MMEKAWILAIAITLFVTITLIIWRVTLKYFRKKHGTDRKTIWGARLYYWQEIIYLSTGITILVLFLLKWANIIYW
jgi:hypothetical protein